MDLKYESFYTFNNGNKHNQARKVQNPDLKKNTQVVLWKTTVRAP